MKKTYYSELEEKIDGRKRKKRIYLGLTLALLLAYIMFFVLYLITPLSRVSNVKLKGDHAYSSEYISSIALSKKNVSLLSYKKEKSLELLRKNDLIENPSISVGAFDIYVDFTDILPVFSYNDISYLSSGKRVPNYIPNLINDINKDTYLARLPQFFFLDGYSTDLVSAFAPFKEVSDASLFALSYVKMKSADTYYLYLKDRSEDFFYRIELPAVMIGRFVNVDRYSIIMDFVHQDIDAFTKCIKNDKINDTDILFVECKVSPSADQLEVSNVC